MRLPRAERIGVPGIAWATKYRDGWAVYVPRKGVVAAGLTRTQANERIDAVLDAVVDSLRVEVTA